jgi:signal transduction histidine kinase
MLRGNLQKVGEHGANTTRTLKAMEEILKDRSGGKTQMDLIALLRQNEEMVHTYYGNEITTLNILVTFTYDTDTIMITGNGEQLSKTFMSLLGNAIYAVRKQAVRKQEQHIAYQPEVKVGIRSKDNIVEMRIHDNGIGIEETIINKIFDPFFTTKPTGEASGVGLYLAHEVIQNYGGDIRVNSVKDEYCELTITLPALTK